MSADKPHDPNSGVLYPNSVKWIEQSKDPEKPRPDFGGEATLLCPHCQKTHRARVGAWNKVGRESGRPLLSLAFSEAKERKGSAANQKQANPARK